MPSRLTMSIAYLGLKGEYIKLHKHLSGDFLDKILPYDLSALGLPPPSLTWIQDTTSGLVECYWKIRGDDQVHFPPFPQRHHRIPAHYARI